MEKTVASSGNVFGLNLFRELNLNSPRTNLFISPLSVSMALGMCLNGAAGSTRDSMAATLALAGLTPTEINSAYRTLRLYLTGQDPTVTLQIANSVWYLNTYSVLSSFLDTNRTTFDADVRPLDFASPDAVATINGWVTTRTNGKITGIITQIPDGMRLYLINAIYFKGTWTVKFDPNATTSTPFHLPGGSTVSCPMMHEKTNLVYGTSGSNQIVGIPYGSGDFRMVVVLPPYGTDVDSLAATVTSSQWALWSSGLDTTSVQLSLPRMEMSFAMFLNDPLCAMGMSLAFSDAANFTGINPAGGLKITEVRHKTYVKVNEDGTEAAAVTSVGVGVTSVGPSSTPVVRVDHPFLFAIIERQSGTILFIGKVVDPTQP